MKEVVLTVLTLLLGGGIGAAVITGLNERWKFKAQRKAEQEDRAAEKAERDDDIHDKMEQFREAEIKRGENVEQRLVLLEGSIHTQSEAIKTILLDRILWLGQGYINKGEISYDDRRRFHAMHDCYHSGLGGNGDADLIVGEVDELPLKH